MHFKNPYKEPTPPNGKRGIIIFLLVILALLAVPMIMAANSPIPAASSSTNSSNKNSSQSSESSSAVSQPSTPSTVELTDIADLRNSAKEEAVKWAMDNMEQYGKVSSGRFSEQTGLHSYTLRYDYRVPNIYGAKEQHVLFLIFTENHSQWQLHAATADGEALQVSNE